MTTWMASLHGFDLAVFAQLSLPVGHPTGNNFDGFSVRNLFIKKNIMHTLIINYAHWQWHLDPENKPVRLKDSHA